MPKIQLLDSATADQIAAGEVVERPSSVVKELVENALDAGATRVEVDLEEGGRKLIRVSDNGEGMGPEDLALSVKRHATSKIRQASDLASIRSFGFRGEALPSIASVSHFTLSSRSAGGDAHQLSVDGGVVGSVAPAGRAQGSTVEVRSLFFNTPARLKFLKSDPTENSRALSDLSQQALSHPLTSFQVRVDGKASLELPAVAERGQRLEQLWGRSLAQAALKVEHREGDLRVHGWVAPPQLSRSNRAGQWLYVNGRVVEHRQLGFHLGQAFGSLLPHGRHPVAALFVELPTGDLDVNVHPAKREVRFRQESLVLSALRHGVSAALSAAKLFTTLPGASVQAPTGGPSAAPWGGSRPSWDRVLPPSEPSSREGDPLFKLSLSGTAPHQGPSTLQVAVSAALRQDWPRPLAQLHRTYLLCQDTEGLVLVDQHAAHERVLYERSLRALAQGRLKSQRLLLPQRLQLSEAQAARLRPLLGALSDFGLELEDVGGALFFISALPDAFRSVPAAPILQDLLEHAPESEASDIDPVQAFRQETAAMLACKAAIKAGDPLSLEEMQQLMADLSSCELPWSCPHGRPPLVKVSLADLEKIFQRR
jgi:DNA mismatch repair protein MutL